MRESPSRRAAAARGVPVGVIVLAILVIQLAVVAVFAWACPEALRLPRG